MLFKRLWLVFAGLLLVLGVSSCAKRGMPEGGPLDSIPPVFVKALPENYSTHFKAKEIEMYFNEYIKLKDPQQQIIISPPLDPKPNITPMGNASKYIGVTIDDTLQENTTYTINFGNAVTDNNEGNILPFFKYVFSTGDYVDSLSISGHVKEAFDLKSDEAISILLYEVDSTYNDSAVYNRLPRYIAHTRDSTNTFTIENMKEGTYKMVALFDKNQNYTYQPKSDKIGFLNKPISVPTDKNFDISIFKEVLDFNLLRPKQVSKKHLVFGYEGNPDSTQIKLLSEKPENFDYRILKDPKTDTLNYWFKPFIKKDSLIFEVRHKKYRDTLVTHLRDMKPDSLNIAANPTSGIGIEQDFEIAANLPLEKLDTTLVSLLDKDSLAVPYQSTLKRFQNKYILHFEKTEKQTYYLQFLPGAITDFYDHTNDTLQFRLKTPALEDLATIKLTLNNLKDYPVIAQLTNKKGEVQKEIFHTKKEGNVFDFKYLKPGNYFVRLIFDKNGNHQWDTGSYLKHRQPEKTVNFPKGIDLPAYWDWEQTFTLP